MHQGALVFTSNRSVQCAGLVDGKYPNWKFLVATQGERRGIHDFEVF
jgi:hypothetical protein